MRRMILIAGAALALAAPLAPAGAQEVITIRASAEGRAWMGISFAHAADAPERARIESVFPESPAGRAGLRAGDVVLRVDGRPATAESLGQVGRSGEPGQTVRLRILRDGAERDVDVVLAERPGPRAFVRGLEGPGGDSVRTFFFRPGPGVELDSLVGGRFRVFADSGIVRMEAGDGRVTIIRTDSLMLRADSLAIRMDSLRERIRLAPGVRERIVVRGDSATEVEVLLRGDLEDPDLVARAFPWAGDVETLLPTRADGQAVPFFWEVGRRALAGAELAEMNEGLGRYFPVSEGLLVLKVSPSTPAARAGLEAGDVVVKAAGRDVRSVRDLRRLVGEDEDGRAELEVVRQGRRRTLELQWDREPVRVFSRSVVRGRGGAPPEGSR